MTIKFGRGLLPTLGFVLVILKALKLIDLPWIWAVMPFLVCFIILVCLLSFVVVIAILEAIFG